VYVLFKKKLYSSKLARLLDTASKFALFSVSGLQDKKLIKSKPTQKLKHANSILESFEYFCQMSSKSIVIILSYTVSKLTRFFETQCRSDLRKKSLQTDGQTDDRRRAIVLAHGMS